MATTTANQGLPYPEEADTPDPPRDFLALANAVEKKLVMAFTSAADRDAKVTAPVEGMLAVLKDVNQAHLYFDGAWSQLYPPTNMQQITSGTTAPDNAAGSNGDLYVQY